MPGHAISRLRITDDEGWLELDARPIQGLWSEEQYLRLSEGTNRLIELVDASIEAVPVATEEHQALVAWLYLLLQQWIVPRGGVVWFAPLRLRIGPNHYREPDILLLRDATDRRRANRYWSGADLVVEVISPDDPQRDTIDKRGEYAALKIAEYWVVDPRIQSLTVLRLDGDHYTEAGVFARGSEAPSPLLPGLTIDVAALFAAWPPVPSEPSSDA